MLKKLLVSCGADESARRVSLWLTKEFVAAKADVAFDLEEGKTYVLWVAQKDGMTKSGKEILKGEWFTVEKA